MKERTYSTDEVMRTAWLLLVEDFQDTLGSKYFTEARDVFRGGGIKAIRDFEWPYRMYQDRYRHKCQYQLESFFKRYQFANDKFTDQQLVDLSLRKFLETQERIATPLPLTLRGKMVLKEARLIAKSILGHYDKSEHVHACRFAKEACVGHTRRYSYLDRKLQGPITGSHEHIKFLEDAANDDPMLAGMVGKATKTPVDRLILTFVPKSFKSKRAVMPDTLAGSFYSSGLGRIIEKRLRSYGLDIRRLQQRHGILARESSKHGRLATADLSSASDSLTLELLKRMLPREWYRAVVYGRVSKCKFGNSTLKLESTCTMGLGHTFPLQTLVFYCLLRAIGNLVGKAHCVISVYGDDLIYDTTLHRYVEQIFPELHLILNKEKTYATRAELFRESCGSDYYLGCDVRPASIEAEHNDFPRRLFCEFLYGLINSLLRRWSEWEIEKTLTYLLDFVFLIEGEILYVPQDYPDLSGAKLDPKFYGSAAPTSVDCNGLVVFPMLKRQPRDREVDFELAYLWDTLRSRAQSSYEYEEVRLFSTDIVLDRKYFKYSGREILRTKKVVRHVERRDKMGRLKRVKVKKFVGVVSKKDETTLTLGMSYKAPPWKGYIPIGIRTLCEDTVAPIGPQPRPRYSWGKL